MAYEDESDWSDSDDGSQQQTSVLLGIPDGEIKDSKDLRDPNVSRLGGKPTFIPGISRPPVSSSLCKVCNNPCEVLLHIWCPFENSPMDRVLYVFGCANSGCQRRPGSIRAFRQLRFNDKYAAKLEKRKEKAQREKEKEAKAAAASGLNTNASSNPFSMGTGSATGPTNLFGSGFGAGEEDEDLASGGSEDDYEYEDGDGDEPEVDDLVDKLTQAAITESSPASSQNEWASHPFYPPFYLNTVFEYISPPKPSPAHKSAGGGATGGEMWDLEQYERASDEDPVFQRFAQRVGEEGAQCIRYELKGTPLAFHTDDVYKKLFPPAPITPGTQVPVTGPQPVSKPTYDPTAIPLCGNCGGKRVFECQLMPNMLNVLKKPLPKAKHSAAETEEARKKLIAAALGGKGGVGMEWGTCMVFACEQDCSDGRETWREEEVWVQWDR
ncbi:programmed cell death protein 2, carboxy-terminal domain protein [Rhizoctonia solani 123E]|uniref:Programmed cell death protein 2, carboxy-terminal domain protein n=1 Tax=Rhizoctonia solani 123E TaxID=1423351 RepID=A0A074S895_9AGAM|nr:programmed cell death protein 2, carboxy-terminal domain protein [Rhizoctonia solani 123E]